MGYINVSSKHMLSEEEQKKYFEAAKNGDKEAIEKLFLANYRLIPAFVYKKKFYLNEGIMDLDDLEQIGANGLINAIKTFDPSIGAFSSYAFNCIKNEIYKELASNNKITKYETKSSSQLIRINEHEYGESLEDRQKSDYDVIDTYSKEENSSLLLKIINKYCSERERSILIERYGLDGSEGKTQQAVAYEEGNKTRANISRIEVKALKKIREILKNQEIEM